MRVRVRFSKVGKVRFVGHRDVARMWERALRKASVAVAYSEGFSPRPRLSFGLALPTGAESLAEYLDIEMVGDRDPAELLATFAAAVPPGFGVLAVSAVERSDPSLQEDVVASSWEILLRGINVDAATAAVDRALAAPELLLERERKGEKRIDDVRPAIEQLAIRVDTTDGGEEGEPVLLADLATRPRGLRPSELLEVTFPDVEDLIELSGRVLRRHQWIERDGARRELLPLDAAAAPHTEPVCA